MPVSTFHERIRRFIFPALSRGFFLRIVSVGLVAWIFFGYLCLPLRIDGISMEPTYRDASFTFCWTPRFWLSPPERGDVVAIRLAGTRVMYLKRVIALDGETVEFRQGKLFVDDQEIEEPYVRNTGRWDLPPRTVKPGHVYVVGDNRAIPMDSHVFGQTPLDRIVGSPLW